MDIEDSVKRNYRLEGTHIMVQMLINQYKFRSLSGNPLLVKGIRTFVQPWFLQGADICSPIELPPRTFVQPNNCYPRQMSGGNNCMGEQMSKVVIQRVNKCLGEQMSGILGEVRTSPLDYPIIDENRVNVVTYRLLLV